MSYLIPGLLLMGLLILAAPISLGYDTGEPWLKIRWLGLSLKKSLKRGKPRKQKTITPKSKRREWAVLLRLWEKQDLRRELLQRMERFLLEVFRTLNFRNSEAGISLPDPMWNGLLYGVMSTIPLENVSVWVNFENRNYAKIRVTVYPYRVMQKVTIFLLQLPYLRILRFAWDLKKSRQDHEMSLNKGE